MEPHFLCGVDVGTTNTKVLLADGAGAVLARVSRPTPRVSDGIGVCTDGDELFDAIEAMIVEVAHAAGAGRTLDAICVAGTGEDGLPLGPGLRPLDLAISWNDRRAEPLAAAMARRPPWREARLSVALDGTRTAAKWAWLQAERPSTLADSTWVALTDYPSVRWTETPFMSESLAARTGCYDIEDRRWQQALLVDSGAPALPTILPGGTIVGPVTHGRILREGIATTRTVVVAGGHDHPMAASLVCGDGSDAALDSLGTAELLYAERPCRPALRRDTLFASSLPIGGAGAALLGVMELSACLEPLLLHGENGVAELMDRIMAGAAVPPASLSDDALFFPSFDPVRFVSEGEPASRVRAVLEGCAFYTRAMLDELEHVAGAAGTIFVAGGWARSLALLQLRADVLGRELTRLDEPLLSALGSARLAARAVGIDPPVGALPTTSLRPAENGDDRYASLFPRYRAGLGLLQGWKVGARRSSSTTRKLRRDALRRRD